MVDRRKKFSLISSPDQCQMSSPSQVSDMPRAGLEPAQNLSSGIVEWSCAVAVTCTPQHPILFLQVIVSMIYIALLFVDILKYLHMCLHKVLYTLLFTKIISFHQEHLINRLWIFRNVQQYQKWFQRILFASQSYVRTSFKRTRMNSVRRNYTQVILKIYLLLFIFNSFICTNPDTCFLEFSKFDMVFYMFSIFKKITCNMNTTRKSG